MTSTSHLRELTLLPPGNQRQLGEQVARIHSRPLDPLATTVGALPDPRPGGRPTRPSHQGPPRCRRRRRRDSSCCSMLLDPSPDVREFGRSPSRPPQACPGQLELLDPGPRGDSGAAIPRTTGAPDRGAQPRSDADDPRASRGGRVCHPSSVAPPRWSLATAMTGRPASAPTCSSDVVQRPHFCAPAVCLRLSAP